MERRGKLIWCSIVGCLMGAVLLFASSAAMAQTAGKVREIRLPSQMPVGQFINRACDLFIAEMEKRTNGALRAKLFPAQQLYTAEQLQHVLPAGGVEMAQIELYKFSGTAPVGMFETPSFLTPDEYYRWMYDTEGGGGFFYKVLYPDFKKKNIHLLNTVNFSPHGGNLTTKLVKQLSDYKGMRIRAGGKSTGVVLQYLGAKAVVMSSADVYMALQRNTIDGVQSSPTSFVSRKWIEIGKYYQPFDTGNTPMRIAANLDFWKSLTPDQQTAIEEAARISEIWAFEESLREHDRCMEAFRKNNVQIQNFPEEQYKEFAAKGMAALRTIIEPEVGKETWDTVIELRKNALRGKATALEMLKKRKFIR